MEKEILTAEEFLNDQGIPIDKLQNLPWFDYGNMSTWLVEFAKLHVQAALEAASKEATLLEDDKLYDSNRYVVDEGNHYSETEISINKDSILNAYLLNNIK